MLLEQALRLVTNATSIENSLQLHTVHFKIGALTCSAAFYCISSLLLKVSLINLFLSLLSINTFAFQKSHGSYLASVEDNEYHTVTLWDWTRKKKLASARVGKVQFFS